MTRHHRLFSADRRDWVRTGDIKDGEALQTQDSVVHAKHAGTEALAPVEVFNLEVFGAHRYFVGEHGVLAHNVYSASTTGVQIGGQAWRVLQPGEVACQSGCEGVARAIQSEIGGAVQQITPAAGRFLGQVATPRVKVRRQHGRIQGESVWRILMPTTEQHVYYTVNDAAGEIVIETV